MLLDLEILNGDMSLEFDKYVNNYTVNVDSNVTKLEIEYKCLDNNTVSILNNNLEYGINYVYIDVLSESGSNLYTLEVYKDKEEYVFLENEVEVEKEMPKYSPYIIGITSLFIIVLTFILLFKKKKS